MPLLVKLYPFWRNLADGVIQRLNQKEHITQKPTSTNPPMVVLELNNIYSPRLHHSRSAEQHFHVVAFSIDFEKTDVRNSFFRTIIIQSESLNFLHLLNSFM